MIWWILEFDVFMGNVIYDVFVMVGVVLVEIEFCLREDFYDILEKIVWESFGSLLE